MSAERIPNELPLVVVPVWPILSPLLGLWCAMLDASTIFAHALTAGRYPALVKVIGCTVITVSINAYCFWTAAKHKACREAFKAIVKEGIGRPAITLYQAGIVVAAVMGFSALFAWTFFFTSN